MEARQYYTMEEEGEPLVAATRAPYGKYAVATALVMLGATSALASSSRSAALFSTGGASAAASKVRVAAYADCL
ncbi:hypothetical protein JL720_3788 [Aureococcus anophagefferens]|nr:hypothetical protein JL720_3788 [Aureococcus anophagefferens]